MTTLEFNRNQLLRQALEPGSECPPLAELLDAAFAGANGATSAEAEALRAHAAGCSACAAELALAGAFDAAAKGPAEAQEIAWVAAQLQPPAATSSLASPAPQLARVLPMAPHAAKRARRSGTVREATGMPLWNRWAAAALVVIGLGFAFEWAHRSLAPALPGRPDALSSDIVRSGEVRLDAPVGVLSASGAEQLPPFAWRAVAGAASYRIELRDVGGDLLWQGESATTTLLAPAELRAKVETFVTYRWNVTALDASASALAHSAAASFRIEPPAN